MASTIEQNRGTVARIRARSSMYARTCRVYLRVVSARIGAVFAIKAASTYIYHVSRHRGILLSLGLECVYLCRGSFGAGIIARTRKKFVTSFRDVAWLLCFYIGVLCTMRLWISQKYVSRSKLFGEKKNFCESLNIFTQTSTASHSFRAFWKSKI